MYVYVYAVVMGQKNSLHMVDPVTWSTRAAQLHVACGKTITLSEAGSVAQRRDATRQHKDGLVHTAWPVAVGRLFQVYTQCTHVSIHLRRFYLYMYMYLHAYHYCCWLLLISLINERTRSRHSGPIMMNTNANLECCHASSAFQLQTTMQCYINTNQYFVMGLDMSAVPRQWLYSNYAGLMQMYH